MALDEAKANAALEYIAILDKKLNDQTDRFKAASEEMARRFELHGESIRISNEKAIAKTIKEEISALEERITERVGLLVQAQTAGQCSDIDSIKEDIDGIRIKVDAIDVRTRDFPLVKGKVEQIESRPGQFAIKAWQKVAAIAGSFIVIAASLLPWIFPRGK